MDPDAFLFKWDTRATLPAAVAPPPPPYSMRAREVDDGNLEELFQAYRIRSYTAARLAELGFTVNTLLNMRDEELDEMMDSVCQIFRCDLLVGERYGIKAAVRAERRRRLFSADHAKHALDASHQEEPVQQEKEAAGSGGGGGGFWETAVVGGRKLRMSKVNNKRRSRMATMNHDDGDDDTEEAEDDENGGGGKERQREHPFIVTVPGEVARGKKNGLDYLFNLYEQCREFLFQVQKFAKERGEKSPTKVTNQVFRYAKKAGASYINKPKMRHYVHCYALHCLDEATSDELRRAFKERGENVGAWRQACYKPLVAIAASQGWDIDAIFDAHPRLSIWYVPTKLRQLCHTDRRAATPSFASGGGGGVDHLP